MEQIYTIPVNEAFDASQSNPGVGCPFCALYRKLQEDELDLILGASMMEPDIRIETNRLGFCLSHYRMMLGRKRKLGMALMLESHFDRIEQVLDGKPSLPGGQAKAAVEKLAAQEGTCYICGRIDKNFEAMIRTAVYLWETDPAFQKKFAGQPYFCLPHYRRMEEYALAKLPKKTRAAFHEAAHGIQKKYLATLREDVSWFAKKFDYRYDEEPWYNSKDSVERSIRFLRGEPGRDDRGGNTAL